MVSQLSVKEISDDLAGSLLHVCDSSGHQEASLASNLCQEPFHVLKLGNAIELDQLVVLNSVQ